MTEDSVNTLQAGMENNEDDFMEMKTLVWMGIISVWITLALLLFIGTGNYKNSKQIQKLSDPERFAIIQENIDAIRKEAADAQKAVSALSTKLEAQTESIAQAVKSELDANARATRKSLAQLAKDQGMIGEQIQAGQNDLSKSIAKEFKAHHAMMGKHQDGLHAALNKLAATQQTVLEAVKSDNAQGAEKRQILKRFFDNQTALLEKLSETFAGGKTAK